MKKLPPPRLKNSSNNENTVKSTAFWLSVRKKWCLEKGIAKEIPYEKARNNDNPNENCYGLPACGLISVILGSR